MLTSSVSCAIDKGYELVREHRGEPGENLQNDFSEIIDELNRQDNADAAFLLSYYFKITGKLVKSIEFARKTIDLHPTHSSAHGILAKCLASGGRFEEAEKHFRKAIASFPGTIERGSYASFLSSQRRFDEAAKQLSIFAWLNPGRVEVDDVKLLAFEQELAKKSTGRG